MSKKLWWPGSRMLFNVSFAIAWRSVASIFLVRTMIRRYYSCTFLLGRDEKTNLLVVYMEHAKGVRISVKHLLFENAVVT